MNRVGVILSLLSVLALSALPTQAAEVPKALLANLETVYVEARDAPLRPGPAVLFEATVQPSAAFTLRLPFHPNRIVRVAGQGASVAAGQAIARIEGPEVRAWLLQAEGVAQRFEVAKQRYEDSLPLFEEQALAASKWAEISDRYFSLVEAMHHVEHTLEILSLGGAGEATVLSPRNGQIRFYDSESAGADELDLAEIVDPADLRLTALVSQRVALTPVQARVDQCVVPVSQLEAGVEGLSRRVWSAGLPTCLNLVPGQKIEGRLEYEFAGVAVPRSAVVTFEGRTGIFIDRGDHLALVPVTVHSSDEESYYVTGDARLSGVAVLSTSVSVARGVLLGLGRD